MEVVRAAGESLDNVSSSCLQQTTPKALLQLAHDQCATPVWCARQVLRVVVASRRADERFGTSSGSAPDGQLITKALHAGLPRSLSRFLQWLLSGLKESDFPNEAWELGANLAETVAELLHLAAQSQCLLDQVQAQLSEAGRRQFACS